MRAGRRRSYIEIQVGTPVKQPNGSMKTEWNSYISLWAVIETLKGSEKVSAVAAYPKADQKITFRFVLGILPTMRAFFNDKIYSILNVNNVDERGREIVLTTETGVKAI